MRVMLRARSRTRSRSGADLYSRYSRLATGPDWTVSVPIMVARLGAVSTFLKNLQFTRAAEIGTAVTNRAERPDGPLAATHRRRGIDCCYDAVYASPELAVEHVEHLWDEALEVGSDHGSVRATLAWRNPW